MIMIDNVVREWSLFFPITGKNLQLREVQGCFNYRLTRARMTDYRSSIHMKLR